MQELQESAYLMKDARRLPSMAGYHDSDIADAVAAETSPVPRIIYVRPFHTIGSFVL